MIGGLTLTTRTDAPRSRRYGHVAGALVAALSLLALAPGQASADPVQSGVEPAGAYLSQNLSAVDDPSLLTDVGLGLLSAGNVEEASEIADQAAEQTDGLDAAAVAKVVVLIEASGGDAEADLLAALADGTDSSGQVGEFGSAFGQAWAVLAYTWAGVEVPAAVTEQLLSYADPDGSGSFGFTEGDDFTADTDSTAMAVMAMARLPGVDSGVQNEALEWLEEQQDPDGSFSGFSAVNTTGLASGALSDLGRDMSDATTWLADQQLNDGGLPGEDPAVSDIRATSQGILGLSGVGYATLGAQSGADLGGQVNPNPGESSDDAENGSPALLIGVVIVVGAAVLVAGVLLSRRAQRSPSRTGAGSAVTTLEPESRTTPTADAEHPRATDSDPSDELDSTSDELDPTSDELDPTSDELDPKPGPQSAGPPGSGPVGGS